VVPRGAVRVSLLAYPLAAMAGSLVGTLVHEATHAVAAIALGELEGVGWQGGLAGGPFVDYRVDSRWRSEAVRKAPLALGGVGAIALLAGFEGATVGWVAAAGVVAGLLWSSPEDLSLAAARQSPTE